MIDELYFATTNKGKIAEAQQILGFPIKIAELELDEIQDSDIEHIVQKKAEDAYRHLQKPVFVDDVGFYVSAWNGFPGPFIKFLAAAGGNELILRMLQTDTNRDVLVKAAIGFCDGKETHVFVGTMPATIATESRGKNGWGFDAIVIPNGYDITTAEMDDDLKNATSHRNDGLTKFKKFLETHRS